MKRTDLIRAVLDHAEHHDLGEHIHVVATLDDSVHVYLTYLTDDHGTSGMVAWCRSVGATEVTGRDHHWQARGVLHGGVEAEVLLPRMQSLRQATVSLDEFAGGAL